MSLTVHSFAYGLHVRSNLPIPGLPPRLPSELVDVDIQIGCAVDDLVDTERYQTRYVSPWLGRDGEPMVVVKVHQDTGSYLWLYSDGQRFVLDPSGRTIRGDWPVTATVEDAALNLLGPIFGFILRLRGITCLHASAVAVGGRALALVGRPSAGKSTTAAALTTLGCALVSEDVVPVVDRGTHYEAIPGYPMIRLWPRAVSLLYGPDALLPLLTPSRDKRRLDLDDHGYSFQQRPLPLAAIYYLGRRSDDDHAPMIERVSRHQALMSLVADTYTNYALDTNMRAREFDLLGRLTSAIPFQRVTPHRDPARLPQLCRAILDDFERLNHTPTDTHAAVHTPNAAVPIA